MKIRGGPEIVSSVFRAISVLLLAASIAVAQENSALPEKLKILKRNHDAAVQRAVEPLNKSYLHELQRLKADYTRAGDLSAAVTADALIKMASDSNSGSTVDGLPTDLNLEQFKVWLSTVVIREQSGFKNTFAYDGKAFTSSKDGAAPRIHDNVIISAGKIFVPFTSTNATITIHPSRSKAEVAYSTGQVIEAKFGPKVIAPARR